jgi:hypothetical protein
VSDGFIASNPLALLGVIVVALLAGELAVGLVELRFVPPGGDLLSK